jgi:hypothetical protein
MPIYVSVRDLAVEGHATGSSHDLNVEIRKPYQNLSLGLHIPYFAMRVNSFFGPYGYKRSEHLLEQLYQIAEYVNRKQDMLQAQLAQLRLKIASATKGRLTIEDFRKQRLELRKQLREGAIDNVEYQRGIGSMRKEVESWETHIWKLEEQFWEGYFQTVISMSCRESIIDVLDGRKPLK